MANTREIIGEQTALDGLIEDSLTEFEESDVTTLGNNVFYRNNSLRNVRFPNVKNINSNAFYGSRIESVSLPSLEEIGTNAFYNCDGLTQCTFPKLSRLNINSFYGCDNLTTLDVGEQSENISFLDGSIENCPLLDKLYIRSSSMAQISNGNEFSTEKIGRCGGAVYVPSNLVSAYKADASWGRYPIGDASSSLLTDFSTISDSWEQILAAESDGTYNTKYKIGDTKSIQMSDGNKLYMQIGAFDADELESGIGHAKISWIGITTYIQHRMGPNNDNNQEGTGAVGGWEHSELRTYLQDVVKPTIPQTIRNAMLRVRKYSTVVFTNNQRQTDYLTVDDIWIPSFREMSDEYSSELFKENSGPIYYDGDFIRRNRFSNDSTSITYQTRTTYDVLRYVTMQGDSIVVATPENVRYIIFGFCT